MRILAIETSCDDTGVAILESNNNNFKVLSNIVSSQTIHQNYGGVFPMMAKREHQNNLVPVLSRALKQAKLLNSKPKTLNSKKTQKLKLKTLKKILEREDKLFEKLIPFLEKYEKPKVDLIAVTNGPGLEPCLWVGVNLAKALSYYWNIPVVPVNHIEAHIAVNFLSKINENSKLETLNSKKIFPAICLVVSGGHTQLILMEKIGKYKIIGETRDDAAGECFDKCAKMIGLGYPGGPAISASAEIANKNPKPNTQNLNLPRPMINSKDYDFSFSGLKTAVLYETKNKKLTKKYIQEISTEIQQSVIDVLIKKTIKAAKEFKAKSIILGGGVSANAELRKQLKLNAKRYPLNADFLAPPKELSTDNALMIAIAGYFNRTKKIAPLSHKASRGAAWQKLSANANLRIGEK